MPKVKTLSVKSRECAGIGNYPSFSKTGSIKGMKDKYYGKDALLVRCGSYIYNVSSAPHYYHAAH
jgi:hypothetical protein